MNEPRVRRVIGGCCGALCLLISVAALAQDAERLVREGVELRRSGDDEAALDKFKQALELERTPRSLAQVGLANQALGRWVEAEAALNDALEGEDDPWIRRHRKTLREALETVSSKLGSIEVTGGVQGATVTFNGREVGTLPLDEPVRQPAGSVVIEATKEGYHPFARTIELEAGALARERISMVDKAPQAPSCSQGQVVVDGHCCWPGQSWSEQAGDCQGTPDCPEGFALQQGACVAQPVEAQPAGTPQQAGAPPTAHEAYEDQTPPETKAKRKAAEGAELSMRLGIASFFETGPGLFARSDAGDGQPFSLRLNVELHVGYRPIRWMSFGVNIFGMNMKGDEDYWLQEGAEAQLWALSLGPYVRGHLSAYKESGTVDLWAGIGFHPYSRVWIDAVDTHDMIVSGFTIPYMLGVSVFATPVLGFELGTTLLHWLPTDYCMIFDDHDVCTAELQPELSWHLSLGVAWLF